MHSKLANLPKYIIFWWVILLTIYSTDFYYYNYILIDKIDTFLVGFCLLHFILKSKYYSNNNITFIVGIFLIMQLQLNNKLLTEKQYLYTYIIIILITLLKSYVDRKRKTNKD